MVRRVIQAKDYVIIVAESVDELLDLYGKYRDSNEKVQLEWSNGVIRIACNINIFDNETCFSIEPKLILKHLGKYLGDGLCLT